MEDLVDSIGDQIENLRKKEQLTQIELSKQAGYDPTYVGKIERGEKSPSLKFLVQIAEVLEIPFLKLFDEIPSSFPVD